MRKLLGADAGAGCDLASGAHRYENLRRPYATRGPDDVDRTVEKGEHALRQESAQARIRFLVEKILNGTLTTISMTTKTWLDNVPMDVTYSGFTRTKRFFS
jgi:hypothetical protein